MASQAADPDDALIKGRLDGIGVRWSDLSVTINGCKALRTCSGSAPAGTLLAVMGPTGCGKTTLLNALSRRGPISTGTVRYGNGAGSPWTTSLKRRVAFVEQDDLTFPALTVAETISFAAALRLPPSFSAAEREERVRALIATLRLTRCADAKVGDSSTVATRGISGGERKRLCIACELVTLPSLLFCDEPTSGLDSATAFVVIDALHELAARGLAVITSIHQPSSQTFARFGSLMLLREGGLIYSGEARAAAEYFGGIGHPCPAGYNHADWLIQLVVMDVLTEEQIEKLEAAFSGGGDGHKNGGGAHAMGNGAARDASSLAAAPAVGPGAASKPSFAFEVRVLARRAWLQTKLWSNELGFLYVALAALAGVLFWRLGYEHEDIWKRFTCAFNVAVLWMFFPVLTALPLIPASDVMLRKELAVGAYRLASWFVAYTSVAAVPELMYCALNVTIFYWMAGVCDSAAAYVLTLLATLLTALTFQSLGFFLSVAISRGLSTAAMLVMSFFFLFTGLFVPLDETPLGVLALVNPLYYAIALVSHIVYVGGQGYAPDPANPAAAATTAAQALDKLSIAVPPARSVGVLLGVLALCRLGALLMLRRKMRRALHTLRASQDSTAGVVASSVPDTMAAAAATRGRALLAAVRRWLRLRPHTATSTATSTATASDPRNGSPTRDIAVVIDRE